LLTHGDLDERALDALKEFPAEGGIAVLKEFRESNLEHVSNKSAYLCGVMKTYRQKNKMMGGVDAAQKKGPDEDKIKASCCVYLLDKTRQPTHKKMVMLVYNSTIGKVHLKKNSYHMIFCAKGPMNIIGITAALCVRLVPISQKLLKN